MGSRESGVASRHAPPRYRLPLRIKFYSRLAISDAQRLLRVTSMPVHSVAIGKHWAFELGMRYPPICPYSLMRNIKRHERVTPIGPVRALTLPWLHGRLPQQGKV